MNQSLKEVERLLPDWLCKLEENNGIVRFMLNLLRMVKFKYQSAKLEIGAYKRKAGKTDERFIKLKEFKGMYEGKRCFIIATGPSLTISDLELLKEEYTFSMNSVCLAYEKTKWRATFFGIQDRFVYQKLESIIKNNVKETVFIGDNLAKDFTISPDYIQFPLNEKYHLFEQKIGRYFAKFSEDCYHMVYDGYSITYSLIEIAAYMGFKEIYLLGADCNYLADKSNHFIEYGLYDRNCTSAKDRMVVAYLEAKKYAESHNIAIYNATRGGALEVFPRVNLEEVLKQ